ncbi:MAG: YHS domain-containing protein [Desulfobacteraceae bacterium]|nr:MAG: YHS domain-containing protein [Desulfobacteraceae bacterium]
MRFIIYLVLAYVAYRILKAVIRPKDRISRSENGGVIDEMVQDPQCKMYIPRRQAIEKTIDGKMYHFCSDACATKFLEEGKREERSH